MQNTLAIAKREFSSYFNSPIAYLVVGVYLILSGSLFFTGLFLNGMADMRAFFELSPMLFFIITPFLTMRLLAEERSQGTLELLLTMPVTDWEVVAGKFLASVGLVSVVIALTFPFAISVAFLGPLDKGATVAGYVGMLLMGMTYSAIGLMASAFTKNQIVAALVALFIGFGLFILGRLVPVMPHSLAPFINAICLDVRFQSIARGVIDTRDLIYFFSMTFGCLLVAQSTLESRRWR
jgi:ABC-2 type transport system permease protein